MRLAARLTGWDIDILTPAEFGAGVQRLDQTLKSVEGVTQEMVDKIIALGLIDVRDIEEVGIEPLMEEVGMPEDLARRVMERCAEEAKIVAVEQEQKKALEASAKAAEPVRDARDEAVLRALGLSGDPPADDGGGTRMPGPMESTEGTAPEITVHKESGAPHNGELSPEEQAVQGVAVDQKAPYADENSEAAALAEGRVEPPK